MKRVFICFISLILIVTQAVSCFATDSRISVTINSKEITFDQEPIIKNGRTLVPIRPVCEALGADVYWNNETQVVVIVRNKIKILLKIGETDFVVMNTTTAQDEKTLNDLFDGNVSNQIEEKELDCVPEIISGRTMLPIRAVCEALNADVKWNGSDNSITIKTTNIKKNTNKTFYEEFCDIFVPKLINSFNEAIIDFFYEAEDVYYDWLYGQNYVDFSDRISSVDNLQVAVTHSIIKSSSNLKSLMHKYYVINKAEEYINRLNPCDINGKLYINYFGGVGTNYFTLSRDLSVEKQNAYEYKIFDYITCEYMDGSTGNLVNTHRFIKEGEEWKVELWAE